jgi:hypothetical protein
VFIGRAGNSFIRWSEKLPEFPHKTFPLLYFSWELYELCPLRRCVMALLKDKLRYLWSSPVLRDIADVAAWVGSDTVALALKLGLYIPREIIIRKTEMVKAIILLSFCIILHPLSSL